MRGWALALVLEPFLVIYAAGRPEPLRFVRE